MKTQKTSIWTNDEGQDMPNYIWDFQTQSSTMNTS